MEKHPAALSFTGGKDCVLALQEVLQGKDEAYQGIEVRVLVTFGPAAAFLADGVEDEDEDDGQVRCCIGWVGCWYREDLSHSRDGQSTRVHATCPRQDSQVQAPSTTATGDGQCGERTAASSLLPSRTRARKGFLAHPLPVIRAQAKALGLPHLGIPIDGAGKGGYLGAYQVR